MGKIKYTVINSEKQYKDYCDKLEELVFEKDQEKYKEEIELLTLLIEDYQSRVQTTSDLDPIELVKSLMGDHNINQKELAEIADISKSYMSEILNYKKRLSKKVIRNLANHFKIRQEALNKPYPLQGEQRGKRVAVTD